MKKKLLVLLLACFCANAQVVLTGSSYHLNANQLYNESPTYPSVSGNPSPDPNTKIYMSYPSGTYPGDMYYLVRKSGMWLVERYSPALSNVSVLLRQTTSSSSPEPSCSLNSSWEVWSGGYGPLVSSAKFTGNYETQFSLQGNCTEPSEASGMMLPDMLSLPRLTSAQISQIVNPRSGSIVYDTDQNTIKVFKTSWVNLSEQNMEDNFNASCSFSTIATTAGGISGPSVHLVTSDSDNSYMYIIGRASSSNLGGIIFNGGSLSVVGTRYFVAKLNNDLSLASSISLGSVVPTSIKVQEDHVYITGSYSTPVVFNGQTYTPIGGSDAILLKINKVSNQVELVKIHATTSNDTALAVAISGSDIYWTGTTEITGVKNTFIRRSSGVNYNYEVSAAIRSSGENTPSSLLFTNRGLLILGSSTSSFSITGDFPTKYFTEGSGKRVFLLSLSSILESMDNYAIFSNQSTNSSFTPVSLGFVSTKNRGVYSQKVRFGINSTGNALLMGHSAFNGGYIVTVDPENLKKIFSINTLNYASIQRIYENYILGSPFTTAANINNTNYFGATGARAFLVKLSGNGKYEGVISATSYTQESSLFYPSGVHRFNGKLQIPASMTGGIESCTSQTMSGFRYSIVSWNIED